MEKDGYRSRWLPLAVAAAIILTNPFMMVAVGLTLGLIFLCCDKRPVYRKVAGAILVPLVGIAAWINPILTFYTSLAAFCGVWVLRKNLFSTVTSSALVACLVASILTVPLVLKTGVEGWREIEKQTVTMQEHWHQLATKRQEADSDKLQNWEKWNRLSVWLLPSQYILMMIASFFLSVILYKRYGETDLPLSLGCSFFNQYRFEDNWIWMVILGLALALLFSSHEGTLRLALNILFVMGIFYVIRGLAVIFYFIALKNGGLILRILVVVLCLTPLILFHLLFGLLDTWVDFRKTVPVTK
ncbi:MAG TPA: DUF2232 domain-containing protein [archaeon]|nr:DUF2232 domain-containing protein [archaeon]